MLNPGLISFDADGTLLKRTLVDEFWFRAVPQLYAERHDLPLEKAVKAVKSQYAELGDEDVRWYLPEYWFDRFELEADPLDVIKDLSHTSELFEDALRLIPALAPRYNLIVTSNASRPFLDVQLNSIDHYFRNIYSCVSDLSAVKKEPEVYRAICESEGVNPKKVIHIGDDMKFDYQVPRQIGISTFLVDTHRDNRNSSHDVEHYLEELDDLLPLLG